MNEPRTSESGISRERLRQIRHLAHIAIQSARADLRPNMLGAATRAPSGGYWQDLDPAEVLVLVEMAEASLEEQQVAWKLGYEQAKREAEEALRHDHFCECFECLVTRTLGEE